MSLNKSGSVVASIYRNNLCTAAITYVDFLTAELFLQSEVCVHVHTQPKFLSTSVSSSGTPSRA